VRASFPQLGVIASETSIGPGGGRNKLVSAARNELIASFDDDSYPMDTDYFSRARLLAEAFPDAAVFAASIFHRNEALTVDEKLISRTAIFGAGGVVFRWAYNWVGLSTDRSHCSGRRKSLSLVSASLETGSFVRPFVDTDLCRSRDYSRLVTNRRCIPYGLGLL